jgi:kinesin family protein C1
MRASAAEALASERAAAAEAVAAEQAAAAEAVAAEKAASAAATAAMEARLTAAVEEAAATVERERAAMQTAQTAQTGALAAQLAEQQRVQSDQEVRLQGTLASLESEKTEVKRLLTEVAAARAAGDAAAATLRAELDAERLEAAAAGARMDALEAEAAALREAAGKTQEQQMEQLASLSREAEAAKRLVATELVPLRAQIADGKRRCDELQQQVMDTEEERRKLHNQLQELRGNVRVFCRVRPPRDAAATAPGDRVAIDLPTEVPDSLKLAAPMGDYAFSFDKVFSPVSKQEEVFSEVSQLVQSALDGYKVCLFSYGQTGSGKTHTMLGASTGEERGIIPRAVEQVLIAAQKYASKGWAFTMEACYVEIYNETVRDLLRPGAAHSEKHTIQSAKPGSCPTVTGVVREAVDSVEAAAGLVRRAAAARAVEATQMNAQSSRSHTLFMLYITGVHAGAGQQLEGCLNLVDLAGSERVERSGATGDRFKEACAINKSLSSLGDVFAAIGAKAAHVPFRNSKLTHLLQPCLGGEGKTLMMVNIAPEESHSEETLCSLRFASQVNACELGRGGAGGGAKRNVSTVKEAAQPEAPAARRLSTCPAPPAPPATRRSASSAALGAAPAAAEPTPARRPPGAPRLAASLSASALPESRSRGRL